MDDSVIRCKLRSLPPSRRGFLRLAMGILSACIGLILGIPFVAALVAPTYKRSASPFARVGEVGPLPQGSPVSREFQFETTDTFIRETVTHEVWILKHSDTDLTVFSPICTHLGCHYDWNPSARQFVCPCHNSYFTMEGKVISGPAPRPLDTLPYRIEQGILFVRWEEFRTGIPEKIRI
jgi:menaquinol-cytochrome c reductase iron-sulfur subunit